MKNVFTMALVMAMAVSPAVAQPLFETDFSTDELFAAWTVIDGNGDNNTWRYDGTRTPSHVYYGYSWENGADDWLISPEITPTADGALLVSYTYSGSSYMESMEVYQGTEATVASMATLLKSHPAISNGTYTSSALVDGKAGVPFRVGFRATSAANLYNLYLISVSVEPVDNPIDLQVTAISSPTTGQGLASEDVTISIANAGLAAAEGFSVGFAVNNTHVATEQLTRTLAPGEQMQYTFQAKADLSAPRQEYTVRAYVTCDGDIDRSNDTLATTVRHDAPATVPYTMGFEPNEYTAGITILNLNGDDGNWGVEEGYGWFNMARTGYGYLGYNYNRDNAANDWAILDPISITEPGYYMLSFWYSGDDSYDERLAVYYGNAPTAEAMTNKVVEYNPFQRGAFEESVSVLHITEPQVIYIGFHAFSDANKNWIVIDDVSLTRIESAEPDCAVTAIASPQDVVRPGGTQDVQFTVSNLGVTTMSAAVQAHIDGTLVHDAAVTIDAQRHCVITIEGALSTLGAGQHTLTVAVTADGDANTANNTVTQTFTVLGQPYLYWDFESGTLPTNITYRSADGGTPSPSAGVEFNEDGWGIFELEVTHALYGDHLLALTSWLNGTSQADRWMELPAVSVTADSPYLVWVASSYNSGYLENYEVHVLNADQDAGTYDCLLTVNGENSAMTQRALSLEQYAGHSVKIAFRLTTPNGDCLILDNIGLYGVGAATGIASTQAADNGTITISGTMATAPQGTKAMAVLDAAGRTLITANAQQIDLTQLPRGLYIVTATDASGKQHTVKMAR